jgi:DNA-binding NarL/FixJ family response regulator
VSPRSSPPSLDGIAVSIDAHPATRYVVPHDRPGTDERGEHQHMIRLFIADDHPVVRAGLPAHRRTGSRRDRHREAASGYDLLDALNPHDHRRRVARRSMPGMSFIETLKRLRDEPPSVKILVLSVHPKTSSPFARCARALPDTSPRTIPRPNSSMRVRRVFRGSRYVSDTLAERLASFVDPRFEGMPHETSLRPRVRSAPQSREPV